MSDEWTTVWVLVPAGDLNGLMGIDGATYQGDGLLVCEPGEEPELVQGWVNRTKQEQAIVRLIVPGEVRPTIMEGVIEPRIGIYGDCPPITFVTPEQVRGARSARVVRVLKPNPAYGPPISPELN